VYAAGVCAGAVPAFPPSGA